MALTDPRIDAYIADAADFARPVLEHLRKIVHKGCPGVEETIKWRMPFFEYNGVNLCYIAAFTRHCALGFWNSGMLRDPEKVLRTKEKESAGNLGPITSVKDLPSDKILISLIKEAAALNGLSIKKPGRVPAAPKPELPVPAALAAALKKNKKAGAAFEAFAPSHRREYMEWITEAKTEETRDKRVATTLEWLVEGKSRNWKYQKK
jgi:uncharacterized protein YdeI (YjbR/CyaY-like superfamily)